MLIIECQNEEAPLSFIALASLNPKAHLLQRNFLLPRVPFSICIVPPSVCVGPISTWSFGPLGSPLSHKVVLLGSDFYSKSELCPLFLTFLFTNNYRRQ